MFSINLDLAVGSNVKKRVMRMNGLPLISYNLLQSKVTKP